MKLLRGLHNLPVDWSGCVATIGNFDGVHRGHQALFDLTVQRARENQLPSVVVLFEPQPREFFSPDASMHRLMRLREKCFAIEHFPMDYVLCLYFNDHLARLSAQDFIETILLEQLKVASVVVGDDFRFGASRQGDGEMLKAAGRFSVDVVDALMEGDGRISSTRVRGCLDAGDFEQAALLLGKPYSLIGRVIHGARLGHELGCPTANMSVKGISEAVNGIHVVRVGVMEDGLAAPAKYANAVASLGYRPTVDGKHRLLEVHVLDQDVDLYGKRLKVEFLHKLRDEEKFVSIEALQQQMAQDVLDARRFFEGTIIYSV